MSRVTNYHKVRLAHHKHVISCSLQLLQDIKKSMIPNKVNLQSLDEKINAGKRVQESNTGVKYH